MFILNEDDDGVVWTTEWVNEWRNECEIIEWGWEVEWVKHICTYEELLMIDRMMF